MISNAQKTPFGQVINRFTASKSAEATHLLGKSPPCEVTKVVSSGIVVVKFLMNTPAYMLRKVTIPVAMSQYDRLPIQVGDRGVAASADFYLGQVSGLGNAGTASETDPGNLSALYFVPLGNSNWSPADVNQRVLYGPDGVLIEDQGQKNQLAVTPSGVTLVVTEGNVTITVPMGNTVQIATVGNLGDAKFVKLADNTNSITLKAQ